MYPYDRKLTYSLFQQTANSAIDRVEEKKTLYYAHNKMLGIIRLTNLTYNVHKSLTVRLYSAHTTLNNQKPNENYKKKREHGITFMCKNSQLTCKLSL